MGFKNFPIYVKLGLEPSSQALSCITHLLISFSPEINNALLFFRSYVAINGDFNK